MIKQYFYVYRITIDKKYHYYGARSTNILPINDLGKVYFSSSTVVHNAINKLKDIKYKIIFTTNTFKEALDLEVKLHSRFDVENHPAFLNRKNQRSHKFTQGTLNKIAVHDNNETVYFIPQNKLTQYLDCGYRRGLPQSKIRASFKGTFTGKTHSTAAREKLSNKASIGITVTFFDGQVRYFKNRLELGKFLNMSPQLGARLVREHWRKDLWLKYNIEDIQRDENKKH